MLVWVSSSSIKIFVLFLGILDKFSNLDDIRITKSKDEEGLLKAEDCLKHAATSS